ncbi:sigma-70 family RNA polymerase sigma factor [Caulobacter sp.]|uniref:RNA polymerase sigma factor n=1 Tax=Caulobacter sp. TaxID=78 RepID=UPI001B066CE7|nr:sigma-70 family RNA polymerase sigma factor [Caulobacter sp.]MBO9544467.1 sigma-70 family RNA polymerase sigma factor [Caulobacter sp.]
MAKAVGADGQDAKGVDALAMHRERARWIARHILPYEAELRRALKRRAPVGFEVDDIIQEAYARLAASPSVDHIHSPRSYLYRMAGGIMTDYARRQKVVPMVVVEDYEAIGAASADPSPEAVVLHRDQLSRLKRIFSQLPPAVAEVFRLRRIDGMSQKEVARRLKVPESTIEKRMARGVYLIAQSWETGGNGEARSTNSDGLLGARNLDHDDPARDR